MATDKAPAPIEGLGAIKRAAQIVWSARRGPIAPLSASRERFELVGFRFRRLERTQAAATAKVSCDMDRLEDDADG
ncbi:MAG: hypothetical protein AAF322_04160 [Pseudomonadota bacterium]